MNGEIRDKEKTMRGLKGQDTPILKGYQFYHNYVRPHEGLDAKTPADVSGIKIERENKWITLIQNAIQKKELGFTFNYLSPVVLTVSPVGNKNKFIVYPF
jgi:hypothetical protein